MDKTKVLMKGGLPRKKLKRWRDINSINLIYSLNLMDDLPLTKLINAWRYYSGETLECDITSIVKTMKKNEEFEMHVLETVSTLSEIYSQILDYS